MDSIKIDVDGSQGLPTLVSVGSDPSISQANGTVGHGGTTQNKYKRFFSCMDEMSDIDIGLNKVFVLKNK